VGVVYRFGDELRRSGCAASTSIPWKTACLDCTEGSDKPIIPDTLEHIRVLMDCWKLYIETSRPDSKISEIALQIRKVEEHENIETLIREINQHFYFGNFKRITTPYNWSKACISKESIHYSFPDSFSEYINNDQKVEFLN